MVVQKAGQGVGNPFTIDRGFSGPVVAGDYYQQAQIFLWNILDSRQKPFTEAINGPQRVAFRS